MHFDMTGPCANCPFRYDIPGFLREDRAQEIADALLSDRSFSCHKTNDYDDETGEAVETSESRHCAGALIFLESQERSNQIMRWMERIGRYDRRKLKMDAPVFDDVDTFVEHHARATAPRRRG
jgi:hypothetical protein